ncbi:PAS domain-containing protein, partial [Methylobacterium sp. E-041]
VVWFGDIDGNVTYCNAYWYAYTGLPANETGETSWMGVIHPDHRDATLRPWLAASRDGRYYEPGPLPRAGEGRGEGGERPGGTRPKGARPPQRRGAVRRPHKQHRNPEEDNPLQGKFKGGGPGGNKEASSPASIPGNSKVARRGQAKQQTLKSGRGEARGSAGDAAGRGRTG